MAPRVWVRRVAPRSGFGPLGGALRDVQLDLDPLHPHPAQLGRRAPGVGHCALMAA